MASEYRPSGVYVPLVTPFTEDDRVDLDALEALAASMLDAGAKGLVALATTGEPTSLTATAQGVASVQNPYSSWPRPTTWRA
jgi:4-hydroxy-tetrahydrodipicolinate synthase